MRGAVWEAEEGIYYWYRYPWPVGREDLLVLYSHRLRKDNNNNNNNIGAGRWILMGKKLCSQ